MDSGAIILLVGLIFFYFNVSWNNKLFKMKNDLEDRERKLRQGDTNEDN